MATMQSVAVSTSSVSSFVSFTSASSSISTSRLQVAAWRKPVARRGLSIRAETPEKGGAMSPAPPSTPPGVSGTEVPLGVISSTAPLEQKGRAKADRMAYVCQACGYIYDLDTPFEEQDDETYQCPSCGAPKTDFVPANATLGDEPYDPTRDGPVDSGKSQNVN